MLHIHITSTTALLTSILLHWIELDWSENTDTQCRAPITSLRPSALMTSVGCSSSESWSGAQSVLGSASWCLPVMSTWFTGILDSGNDLEFKSQLNMNSLTQQKNTVFLGSGEYLQEQHYLVFLTSLTAMIIEWVKEHLPSQWIWLLSKCRRNISPRQGGDTVLDPTW